MLLSRRVIPLTDTSKVVVPSDDIFQLPEKVLQFGTGVLLRGLPDYFIDKANRQGVFNGRVVVIKSTASGDIDAFNKQEGLYTICVRGLEEGKVVEENILSSSISRVLSAKRDWDKILQCASNPAMEIIISNTTEVGIQFVKEDIFQAPPASFPGKLLRFLYERYKVLNGKPGSGMIIIPTELIVDNGKKLESIITTLAHENGLGNPFIRWLEHDNHFCSSLVDRIVPGKPNDKKLSELEAELNYEDELLIVAEPYSLWAIEGDAHVQGVLSFSSADKRVIITENIDGYRELKLRLLNGTHTLSCGLAHLTGFTYVVQAMEDKSFSAFVTDMMLSEIALAIPFALPENAAKNFGLHVLERFRNPYIRHQWLNITLNYTSKMKSRVIPVLIEYFKKYRSVPVNIALGFAAYLLFMKAVKKEDGKYYGKYNDQFYFINDDQAPYFYQLWQNKTIDTFVSEILQDKKIWGEDLSLLEGFRGSVTDMLITLTEQGSVAALSKIQPERVTG